MKNILYVALLSVVAAVPFHQASAQTEERMAVTVPFAFHVGQATLPAGSYTIVRTNILRGVIGITGADPKLHVDSLVMIDSWGKARGNLAVFHRYGNQYFLSRIVRSDTHTELYLTPSKAEKRARHQTELAGLAIDDPVIVALNDNAAPLPTLEASR
jgi:hypothetical protein